MCFIATELQETLANSIATAMLEAAANLQDGSIGIGISTTHTRTHSCTLHILNSLLNFLLVDIAQLTGVTENRRADISPYLKKDDIDPNLGVISVNDGDGKPLATGIATISIL